MLRICAFVVTVVALIIGPAASYSYVEWDVEPVIDYNKDPGIARSVFFIHMRKAAGTAVRQFFREAYQRLQCMPLNERKLVHSDQSNWRCKHLAFYHVEWQCFIGSEIIRLRKQALESGQLTDTFKVDAKLNIFYPERNMRLITCLRHPIDRLISITWYGESSHGMKYMKYLHSTGQIGEDKDGNDISSQPDGQHKRTWYRNSVDLAKRYAAQNATLWNRWVSHVDQSTIWNYYVTRLAGGECAYKDNACRLAARCFAMGHERGGDGVEDGRAMDKEHPAGCRALFTNDHSFEKPLFNQKRSSDPDRFGVEEPAPPGPWPMARWVDKALSQVIPHLRSVCVTVYLGTTHHPPIAGVRQALAQDGALREPNAARPGGRQGDAGHVRRGPHLRAARRAGDEAAHGGQLRPRGGQPRLPQREPRALLPRHGDPDAGGVAEERPRRKSEAHPPAQLPRRPTLLVCR